MRDFNDYQFFTAVVRHRGFSASARALNVPKSRISRRVAELEERLGVRLLDRTSRGVKLTEVGQQVFDHASAAIAALEAAESAALQMQSEPRGLVRISCPLGLQGVIADALPAFLASHPRLHLQCVVTNRRVDLIHEGIDVAIRVRERLDTDADLHVRRIGLSRRVLVSSPALVARLGAPTTPSQLFDYPTLHQDPQGTAAWHLTSEDGTTTTVAIEPQLAAGSFEMLIAAASQGVGIALLPLASCREALDAGVLVRLLPEWSGIDGILHLVFLSKRGMLPGVRAVIEFAAETLKAAASP